jgi:hypothetical protein
MNKIEKVIKNLEARRKALAQNRDFHLVTAKHMEIMGLYDVADDERIKAHNFRCRISEVDILIGILEGMK